jgi:hypothetical protein
MPLYVALIEPESELVNVPAKVFRADMVKGSIDAALQNSPDTFNAIGRNVVADIFASTVIDGFVFKARCYQPR